MIRLTLPGLFFILFVTTTVYSEQVIVQEDTFDRATGKKKVIETSFDIKLQPYSSWFGNGISFSGSQKDSKGNSTDFLVHYGAIPLIRHSNIIALRFPDNKTANSFIEMLKVRKLSLVVKNTRGSRLPSPENTYVRFKNGREIPFLNYLRNFSDNGAQILSRENPEEPFKQSMIVKDSVTIEKRVNRYSLNFQEFPNHYSVYGIGFYDFETLEQAREFQKQINKGDVTFIQDGTAPIKIQVRDGEAIDLRDYLEALKKRVELNADASRHTVEREDPSSVSERSTHR